MFYLGYFFRHFTDSNFMKKIVLASSSKYRRALMNQLGLRYDSVSPDIDESPLPNESPAALVHRLAYEKAARVVQHHPDAIVIASDQVACIENTILTKPGNRENAFAQLSQCSGQTVTFYTSLCVLDPTQNFEKTIVEPFIVGFRTLSEAQINGYIDREQPFDCAGSFKSEGLGIALFKFLNGRDTNALVGLPLIELTSILFELGVDVLEPTE